MHLSRTSQAKRSCSSRQKRLNHRRHISTSISRRNSHKIYHGPSRFASTLEKSPSSLEYVANHSLYSNKKAQKALRSKYRSFLSNSPRQILSGIQPTGVVHIGNLFGAISNWVTMQYTEPLQRQVLLLDDIQAQIDLIRAGDTSDGLSIPRVHLRPAPLLFSIVDLHAITIPKTAHDLNLASFDLAATLMACGINSQSSTLFLQSHVPQHTELGWLLTCNTPVSWLYRMTQFKDKSSKLAQTETTSTEAEDPNTNLFQSNAGEIVTPENEGLLLQNLPRSITAGLLQYPCLMAADILLYNATHIPVGDDQVQHLEFSREVARAMNSSYGHMFVEPQPIHNAHATRVMSLRTPTSKMSKSDPSEVGKIGLTDSDKDIQIKIQRAVTDAIGGISYSPDRPGLRNLIDIYVASENMQRLHTFNQETQQLLSQKSLLYTQGILSMPGSMGRSSFVATTDQSKKLLALASQSISAEPNSPQDVFAQYSTQFKNIVNRSQNLLTPESVVEKHASDKLSVFKPMISDSLISLISPIRTKTIQLQEDPEFIYSTLDSNARIAGSIANITMSRVKELMGFIPHQPLLSRRPQANVESKPLSKPSSKPSATIPTY